MNIYVLLKRTFDTEEKISLSDGAVNEDGAKFIINPYDEYAAEEAIVTRDAHGGEVTVITAGNDEAETEIQEDNQTNEEDKKEENTPKEKTKVENKSNKSKKKSKKTKNK